MMEALRREILPNIYLTTVQTGKFKTGCMSATLLTQLDRQTASANALIPRVLRRGSVSSPDMAALQARLDELYGESMEPVVMKKGEVQCVGFRAGFCDDRFLPGETDVLGETAALLGELLLAPNTRGGLFLPAYVESERDKLVEQIGAIVNDKGAYATRRLVECMCSCEDYGVSALGTEESAGSLHYVQLTRHYRQLLATSPLELFYCGSAETGRVEEALRHAFLGMSRGELNEDIGTDVRMNTLESETRYFTEEMDVTQGNLALGFRLGKCMEEPDEAVLRVLNAVYGGCVTSKLFMNVREKLSLCYYASSLCDLHKGIMLVRSGIDFDKYDAALTEIRAQLDAVKAGDISPEELSGAKNYLSSSLRSLSDSPAALESFYLDQCVDGLLYSPEELAALVEDVTLDEVVAAAQDIQCDAVYFLKGREDEHE